jgi:hypothetical protein
MTKIAIGCASFAMLAMTIGLAGPAAAAGANDAVNDLRAQGYTVQLNGTPTANLDQCTITNVKKDSLGGPNPTAYVDFACPTGC